jgi:nucleotidyltransferase/DNA polymerase involved in DNA repair
MAASLPDLTRPKRLASKWARLGTSTKRKSPAKALLSGPAITRYGDMIGRVMKTLAQFTPDLEVYSIDEAFLGDGWL